MEKYEAFDAILDFLIKTHSVHAKSVIYHLPAFKGLDPARVELMLEEMHKIAPKMIDRKDFYGSPLLVLTNYTHLLKEEGGFMRLLEAQGEKPIRKIIVYQKADGSNPLADLHPKVQENATDLFLDGHYRQPALDTYIALDNAVQAKSELPLTGMPLMDAAFSQANPVLQIPGNPDERQGFMFLYKGAMAAIRNAKAHHVEKQNDPQQTLEWLSFASALFRALDQAQFMPDAAAEANARLKRKSNN